MSWSGGTYTKGNNATGGWTGDASLGIGIEAGRHDTQDDDFASGINNCIAKDGQNTPTANLPMGGYKHTGVANASSNDEYTTQGQLKDNSFTAELEALEIAPTSTALALDVTATAGASGEFASFKKNGGDKVLALNKLGFVGVNTDSPIITTEVPFQVYPQNGVSGQTLCFAQSEISDNEAVGWFARGFRSGGSVRQASVGVRTHASLTNAAGFLYVQEEDGGNAYIWADNSQQMRVSSNAAHVGTTSGVVIGTQTSDERLKEIDPAGVLYGLDTVKQLKPIAYVRKDDPDQAKRLGFGAQTTKAIVPEAVYDTREELEGEDPAETKLAMDYTTLIPVLVKAIQELEAKVASLEAQLAT